MKPRCRTRLPRATAEIGIAIGDISLQSVQVCAVLRILSETCQPLLLGNAQIHLRAMHHLLQRGDQLTLVNHCKGVFNLTDLPFIGICRLPSWKLSSQIVFVISLLWHTVENKRQRSKIDRPMSNDERSDLSCSPRSAILTFDVTSDHMTISMILPLYPDLNVSLDGDG